MTRAAETLAFYQALQAGLRTAAGKALTPLLKRWRYTQSSEYAALALLPDSFRFLTRYGHLDAGKEAGALLKDYHALLTRIARDAGDAPGVVAAWLELFAAGEYGVLQNAFCAPEPRCGACPLKEGCRYLAAGAKDARAFGRSLAQDLLLAAAGQAVDLRVSELLAFILCGEKSGAADIARAEAAVKACGGLRGVFLAQPEALRELGFAEAACARLRSLSELCRRWADEKSTPGRRFACGQDFYDHFHLRLRDLKQEVFIVVLLDQKNCLLAEQQVSTGILTETLVHPREVFAEAIARRAASVALVHNHPSGDPMPSPPDKAITKRLESVAKLIGIRLLDHVVTGDGAFFSFAERGWLG